MAQLRYKPRFLKSGGGNVLLENGPTIVGGVILTATRSNGVSLSVHDLATGAGFNSSSTRRLVLTTKATGSVFFNIPFGLSTGCAVSLSGVGGVATLMTTRRR